MPDFHVTFSDLLHAVNLRHGTNGFLLPFRRKACWGFSRHEKSRRLRPGLNPRTWVPKASTLPLDHRSRCETSVRNRCLISLKSAILSYFTAEGWNHSYYKTVHIMLYGNKSQFTVIIVGNTYKPCKELCRVSDFKTVTFVLWRAKPRLSHSVPFAVQSQDGAHNGPSADA